MSKEKETVLKEELKNEEKANPKAEAAENEKAAEESGAAQKEEKADEGEKEEKTEAKEAPDEKYIHLLADYQNLKRRFDQEKQDIYAYANEKIVKDMLDVIDNFGRALETECADEKFKEGMDLIFKQLLGVLEKAGVSEIEALGKEFDPNFHNAVMMEDNPDFESGQVTCVLQKGYILNSRVIRPSMVKVAN